MKTKDAIVEFASMPRAAVSPRTFFAFEELAGYGLPDEGGVCEVFDDSIAQGMMSGKCRGTDKATAGPMDRAKWCGGELIFILASPRTTPGGSQE